MISEQDIKRRDRLLGMLTSQFDGERATAGSMLAKLAAQYKMTVPEFCQAGVEPQKEQTKAYDPKGCEMLMMLRKVLDNHFMQVTDWELKFLESVSFNYSSDKDLSDKQRKVALRILNKIAMHA